MSTEYRYEHTRADAEKIAETIEIFHHAQGAYQVKAWVELVEREVHDDAGNNRHVRLYETKSNLVNGLPPRV